MMIAAHPEMSIQVDGHYVGIVLAVSEHPHLLPERSNNVRIVEAGAQMSRGPRSQVRAGRYGPAGGEQAGGGSAEERGHDHRRSCKGAHPARP